MYTQKREENVFILLLSFHAINIFHKKKTIKMFSSRNNKKKKRMFTSAFSFIIRSDLPTWILSQIFIQCQLS